MKVVRQDRFLLHIVQIVGVPSVSTSKLRADSFHFAFLGYVQLKTQTKKYVVSKAISMRQRYFYFLSMIIGLKTMDTHFYQSFSDSGGRYHFGTDIVLGTNLPGCTSFPSYQNGVIHTISLWAQLLLIKYPCPLNGRIQCPCPIPMT